MKQELQQKVQELQQQYSQFGTNHKIWKAFYESIINLEGEHIGFYGANIVAVALKYNTALTTIVLSYNHIEDEGAEIIAKALRDNTTLIDIHLGSNQIRDAGAQAIADALRCNKTLTKMNLFDNEIGYKGVKAIGEALMYNTKLTMIALNWNKIGDEGVKAIAEALKYNTTLTCVHLDGNLMKAYSYNKGINGITDAELIGDEGVKAIAEALKYNTTLTDITLSYNRIGDEGAQAIDEALMHNTKLTKINLNGNPKCDERVKAINLRQQGNDLLVSGEHQEALNKFQQAYNICQHDKYKVNKEQCTLLVEGDNYFKTQMYAKAIEKYKESMFSRDGPDLFIKRAKDINELAKNAIAGKIQIYEQAIIFIDEALRVHPNNHEAISLKFGTFMSMSDAMLSIKHYDGAFEYLNKAAGVDIEQFNVVKKARGNIFNKQGKHEEALDHFVSGEDGFNEALIGIAKKYENQTISAYGQRFYDLAMDSLSKYEDIVRQVPDNLITSKQAMISVKGRILVKQQNPEGALEYLQQNNVDKNDIAYKEAMDAIDAIVKKRELEAKKSYQEGDKLLEIAKYQEALSKYKEACNINPNVEEYVKAYNAQYLHNEGILLFKSENYQGAYTKFLDAYNIRQHIVYNTAAQEANTNNQISNKAKYLYQEGNELLEMGKYQDALNKYKEAYNIKPDQNYVNVVTQLKLIAKGDEYFNKNNFSNALNEYKKSDYVKDNDSFFINLAEIIFKKGSNTNINILGFYDKALDFIKYALEINSLNTDAVQLQYEITMGKINFHCKTENYADALKHVTEAKFIMPEQIKQIRIKESEIYCKEGKYEEAIKLVERGSKEHKHILSFLKDKHKNEIKKLYSAQLYDDVSQVLNCYDRVCEELYDEKNDMREELSYNTVDTEINNIRGTILLKQGKHQEAIKYLDKDSIGYKDCLFVLHITNGHRFYDNGDYEKAKQEFIEADKIQKNDSKCAFMISKLCIISKDYGQAIGYLEKLNVTDEVRNLKALSYNEKGKYHYDREEYKDAVKCFELAQDNSNEAIYKKNYAHALLETGAYQKSIAIFKQINDQAGLSVAFNRYGNDYSEKGKYDSAKQCFEEACKLAPANILYKNNLGFALLNLGAYKEAEKVFNEVLSVATKDERALEGQEIVFNNIVKNNTTNVPDKVHYYKKLIELFGQNAKYLYELSQLYHSATELLLAKNCVKQAIKIDHNYQEAIDFYCIGLNGEIKDIFQ